MNGRPLLRRGHWIALGALFLALLWLPIVQAVLPFAPEPKRSENRAPAKMPELRKFWRQPEETRRGLDAYFSDHFGFRKTLVLWHNVLLLRAFGISPVDKILVGKAGWLFLAPRRPPVGPPPGAPLSEKALEDWRMELEQRHDALAAEGVRFVALIAPEKGTVYPEYLPDWFRRETRADRLGQLTDYLRAHSTVEWIDLRPALAEAKARMRLYHRTDNHWNALGGYVGYRAIMEHLARRFPGLGPGMAPRPLSAFTVRMRSEQGGNQARMLAMGEWYEEQVPLLEPKRPFAAREAEVLDGQGRPNMLLDAAGISGSHAPRALMLHDSFGNAIAPLLAEHFSRVVFARTRRLDMALVRREQPDVVIQEMGEGVLRGGPPD